MSAPAPISLRAYSERRGVSVNAVSKAILEGRLSASVVRVNGRPKIADADLADREWMATTDAGHHSASMPPGADDDGPVERETLADARARRESALADMAEMERDVMRGELMPQAEHEERVADAFAAVRSRLLGVPTRAKQRAPHLTQADVGLLDDLIREALEELAGHGD